MSQTFSEIIMELGEDISYEILNFLKEKESNRDLFNFTDHELEDLKNDLDWINYS